MHSRRLGLGALAASLTLVVGVGTATGFNGATSITLDHGGPTGAEGHLTAAPRCEAGRKVTLFLVDPQTGYLKKIGSDLTDGSGNWEVDASLFKGDYKATVDSKPVRVHGKRKTCRSASSLSVHL